MRHKVLRAGLRLVGPVLLAIVLLRMKEPDKLLGVIRQVEAAPFLGAVALTFLNLQLKVTRWEVLLRTQGIHYSMKRAWAAYLGSSYIGMLTPGRVGDAVRAQYLRHDLGVSYAEGIASVVMDRICDLYVLVVFASIGVLRFGSVLAGDLAYSAWATVALIILGPLVLFVPGLAEGLMLRAYQKFAKSADPSGFSRFLAALRSHVGRVLSVNLLLTTLAFLVNYAQAWLLSRALHLQLTFFDLMCLLSIVSILSLLPISISGVGVRELFFSLAFPVLGYGPEIGISFGLLVFAVMHLVMIGVGFVSFQVAPPPVAAAAPAASAGASRLPPA